MEAKYICAELPAAVGSCFGAVIFPNFMGHDEVARALRVKPTSAGMCQRDADGQWYCFGRSMTLGLDSKPDDEVQLNRMGGS